MREWETIWYKAKRVGEGVLLLVIWPFATIYGVGLAAVMTLPEAHLSGPGEALLGGFVLSMFVWCGGLAAKWFLLSLDDPAEWLLCPMTPAALLRRNIRRHWPFFAGLLAIGPIGLVVPIAFWLGEQDAGPSTTVVVCLDAVLFYLAAMVVPLIEFIRGRRSGTGLLFVLRHPLRRLWPLVLPALIVVAQAGGKEQNRFTQPVLAALQRATDLFVDNGALGQAALFVLSPVSGIGFVGSTGHGLLMGVAFAVVLSLFLVYGVYRIWQGTRVGPLNRAADSPFFRNLDAMAREHPFAPAVRLRETFERLMALLPGRRALHDDSIRFLKELPYDPSLPPEPQTVRHVAMWELGVRSCAPVPARLLRRLMLSAWPLATGTLWYFALKGGLGDNIGQDVISVCAPLGIHALFTCLFLQEFAWASPAVPLRWSRLLRRTFASVLKHSLTGDLILLAWVAYYLGQGVTFALLIGVTIQAGRAAALTSAGPLASARYAGLRWPSILADACLLAWLLSLVCMAIILGKPFAPEPPLFPFVAFGVFAMSTGLLQLGAFELLAAHVQRQAGSAVLGAMAVQKRGLYGRQRAKAAAQRQLFGQREDADA